MSKIRLSGSNSGYVEIAAAADAGNLTFTMPTTGTALFGNGNNVISGITTFSAALDINSTVDVSGTSVFNNDVTFDGATAGYDVVWDRSDNALEFAANAKATFGASQDMQLYHDGNHGYIADAGTGNLRLRSGTLEIQNLAGSKTSAVFSSGGGQTLNFNNTPKFVTTNTGAVVTGICTATSFSGSGEGLTRTTQLSHRNIIINGAMLVAQRGTSSTSGGYQTVDRFSQGFANVNENPTMQQTTVAAPSSPYNLPTSGAHPYKEGFRKAYYVQNGNQTTAAGANQDMSTTYFIEGQDLVGSGWDYTDPNSYLTISFWVKTTVAQTYYVGFRLYGPSNGNQREYCFNFTPAAFTWTKVTHSIPGHASNTLRDDNQLGAFIQFVQYWGTNYTSSGRTNEAWQAKNNNSNYPDIAGNWYNTNDASYQITGLQLEVGQQATPFEHRSFGEELSRCERYFQCMKGPSLTTAGSNEATYGIALAYNNNRTLWSFQFKTEMRTNPTVSMNNLSYLQGLGVVGGWNAASSFVNTVKFSKFGGRVDLNWSGTPFTAGHAVEMRIINDGLLGFDAEL